jgi:hypothetical protein
MTTVKFTADGNTAELDTDEDPLHHQNPPKPWQFSCKTGGRIAISTESSEAMYGAEPAQFIHCPLQKLCRLWRALLIVKQKSFTRG